jgi:hypothetical protein
MSKSLSESAAEILATSLGSSKKDGMVAGPGAAVDLGGQTPTTGPEAIGAKASANAKEAPKPGTSGAPAEGTKKTAAVVNKVEDEQENPVKEETQEEDLPELTEEEIEAYLDSLTEEELEELAALSEDEELLDEKAQKNGPRDHGDYDGESEEVTSKKKVAEEKCDDDEDEDEDDDKEDKKKGVKEEVELTEEEVAAARTEALKALVSENMGSCAQDIDALFSGESLSEEFKTKAVTIFEAAVRSRVEAIVEKVSVENEAIMESTVADLEAQMTSQVDDYLNYVVEQWMEDNKLAVESGLRVEIAEDFMAGLKNLFTEHYIEVPEDKANLVEELAAQVAAKEEALAEQVAKTEELTKALNESKSGELLRKACDGLTEVQVAKIKSLAEGVEFTTEGEYSQKLAVIRENYFPSGKKVSEAPQTLVETESREVAPMMDRYVQAISKQLPK